MYRFNARPPALIAALLAASLGAASLGGTVHAAGTKSLPTHRERERNEF